MISTPTTIIADNNNENSSDPNPYAYPYFNSHDEIPLLYRSVNSFISLLTKLSNSPHLESLPTESQPTESQQNSPGGTLHPTAHTQMRVLESIVRKITTRCAMHPKESGWVDSCGENSLFRLCQLARFHNSKNRCRDGQENDCIEDGERLRHRCDDLILVVQKALMDAEPRAAFTVNNWNETPLHEFLKHCGFQLNDQDDMQDVSNRYHNANITERIFPLRVDDTGEGNISDYDFNNHVGASPNLVRGDEGNSNCTSFFSLSSVAFAEGLINNCPLSILTRNFQKGLPIHEVCSIVQASRYENTDFPYAAFDMESFLLMTTRTASTASQRIQERNQIHVQILQKLINLHPKSLLLLDHKQKTPLYRAVQSINCSVVAVVHILKAMELHFSGRSNPLAMHTEVDKNLVKAQIRRAIFGLQEPCSDGQAGKEKIASPLSALWKVFLHPRRVTEYMTRQLMVDGDTIYSNAQTLSLSQIMLSYLSEDMNGGSGVQKAKQLVHQLGDIWTKTLVLMNSAYHGSVENISMSMDGSSFLQIHAAISCKAPRCITELFMNLFPHDLQKKDEQGKTPLILVLSEQLPSEKESNRHIIEGLTRIDRSIAMIPDQQGKLPLHIALDKHLGWTFGTKEVFEAYPNAVSIPDPITLSYPFLKAAASGGLSMTYMFLRSDPSVICRK